MSNVEPGYLKKLLPEGPPQDGESWADIQKDIESKIMPGLTHWYVCRPHCCALLIVIGNRPTSWPSSQLPPPSLGCSASSTQQHSPPQHSTGSALPPSQNSKPLSSTGSRSSWICQTATCLQVMVGVSFRVRRQRRL